MKRKLLKLTIAIATLGLPAFAWGQSVRPLPGQSSIYPGDDAYGQIRRASETSSRLTLSDDQAPLVVDRSASCTGGCSCGGSGCTAAAGTGCSCDENFDGYIDPNCGSRGLWGTVEYMHVWTKGRALPPLVTTSNVAADEGVLGRATTRILFGGDEVGRDLQSAGRVFAGKWIDNDGMTGVAIRFMGMEGDRSNFHQASTGVPLIAVPFFNADPLVAAPDSVLAGGPGITGSIGVKTSNDIYSIEPLLRIALRQGYDYRLDVIGGYHHTLIDDGLTLNTITAQGATMVHFRDGFNARNEFHGGSFGFIGEFGTGPWTASLLAKLSVGKNFEQVRIEGQNVTDVGGVVAVADGGIFAQTTNIGTYFRDEIVYVPEVALSVNRRLTDHLDFSLGYSFMYWSEAVLAGDQIDTTIDGGLLQGGPGNGIRRPAFNFRETDFYLHAMTFGLNYRY